MANAARLSVTVETADTKYSEPSDAAAAGTVAEYRQPSSRNHQASRQGFEMHSERWLVAIFPNLLAASV